MELWNAAAKEIQETDTCISVILKQDLAIKCLQGEQNSENQRSTMIFNIIGHMSSYLPTDVFLSFFSKQYNY